jgi:hypothetical protein
MSHHSGFGPKFGANLGRVIFFSPFGYLRGVLIAFKPM